jgi:SNF2 family DNA or RNA helicase
VDVKSYGAISLEKGKWAIRCEPHVMIRLKRLFPRAWGGSAGKMLVSSTPEVCRDLEWVLDRYPMTIDKADKAALAKGASQHLDSQELVSALLSGERKPREFKLAMPAREYQSLAAEILLSRGGLLLADDLGLGKSCSALCALASSSTRPALVVTMSHLTRQWRDEAQKFLPEVPVHVIRGTQPYDLRSTGRIVGAGCIGTTPEIIISTYSRLAGWADNLAGAIRTIVLDECQELRGGQSRGGQEIKKNVAAKQIAEGALYRIGLSATPFYNYAGEMWNVLDVISPGGLGSRSEFLREWCGGDEGKVRDPEAFGSYLREHGMMLRRNRADVGRELPPVIRIPHHVDIDHKVIDDVSSAADELAKVILSQADRFKGERFRAREELSNLLRQATGVAKAPHVADMVRLLVESDEQVVLFGWHREVYEIWKERLANLNPVLYTGSESPAQKNASREAFLKGQARVLMMSLRSGAGLDGLQLACRTVVFGELDWSPGVHEQCVGRLHRDGQSTSVLAYYLISGEGSDPVMAEVLGLKRAQIEGVRDPVGKVADQLDATGDHMRRLAELHLGRKS